MSRKSRELRKQWRRENLLNTEMQVFKIQRPVMHAGGPALMLLYNEDRSLTYQLPMTKALNKIFGERYKLFVEAQFVNGDFLIGNDVPDPGW